MRKRLRYSNDDKSPLIDLLNCIVCKETMKIEKSSPDADGMDVIQYRRGLCDRIERVRQSAEPEMRWAEGEGEIGQHRCCCLVTCRATKGPWAH